MIVGGLSVGPHPQAFVAGPSGPVAFGQVPPGAPVGSFHRISLITAGDRATAVHAHRRAAAARSGAPAVSVNSPLPPPGHDQPAQLRSFAGHAPADVDDYRASPLGERTAD